MEVEKSDNNKEIVIERAGKETVNVKLADNTGKKSETSKRKIVRRKIRRFRGSLGRRNYIGNRNRKNNFTNKNQRRQRGLTNRRRGVKIIVRNLTRNATNTDIKALFEKIGPLRRCGINWNNLGESKGTAEVEYYYRRDAFKACRKLDYKAIRGVPIRLEMREGLRRILLHRLGGMRRRARSSNTAGRRLRKARSYGRSVNRRNTRSSSTKRNNSRRNMRRSRRNSRNDRKYKTYNN